MIALKYARQKTRKRKDKNSYFEKGNNFKGHREVY